MEPRTQKIAIVGAGAAVLIIGIVIAVVIIRARSSDSQAEVPVADTKAPSAAVSGSAKPVVAPTVIKDSTSSGSALPPQPHAPAKVGDYVDPSLIDVVQLMTNEEKKSLGLPLDVDLHYKWIVPKPGSPPIRILLDLPATPAQEKSTVLVPKPTDKAK